MDIDGSAALVTGAASGLGRAAATRLHASGAKLVLVDTNRSIVGTRTDMQEVFELHAAGKTEVVYERRQLEDVNSAIHEVETGQVKARLVFDLH